MGGEVFGGEESRVKPDLREARLYAICDLGYLAPESAVRVSRRLLEGGAGILQLRAKGHPPENLEELAGELNALCGQFGIPFIVNDHVELAKRCGAEGVHLGQDDGSIEDAKSFLGSNALVGRSTHSLQQARAALAEGADYIGFGPLYPTPTKKGRPAIGLDEVSSMENEVGSRIPAFCIGGIHPGTIDAVLGAGAHRVVVVSHLLASENPKVETEAFLQSLS